MAKTYGTKGTQVINDIDSGGGILYYRYIIFTEQFLDDIPSRLVNREKMTCEQALAWCVANIPTLIGERTFMRAGTSIPTCSAIVFPGNTGPCAETPPPGVGANNGGWAGSAFGQLSPFDNPANWNMPRTSLGNASRTLGGLEDLCTSQKIGGGLVELYVADGTADAYMENGNQTLLHGLCGFSLGVAWYADIYGTQWPATCEAVTSITDVTEWFYEQMPACLAPAPIPSGAPNGGSFGIPRPAPEDEVPSQENMNTPPLDSFIKLSNHTFQFRNNFGRVK